jgi:dTDP-4-dehydrorhamnose reductase
LKVLITGAAGMLGTDLRRTFEQLVGKENLILADIAGDVIHLDITDTDQTFKLIIDSKPDVVIHSAAYTDVDGCEKDKDKAFRVNGFGTWNVAAACSRIDAILVYISTDFVFDGEKGEPYTEYDEPNPIGWYGASKLAGERHVQALCSRYYIVRTAWLYGKHGKNFPLTILNAAKSGKPLKVVADQTGSPTYTADLAAVICELIENSLYGIYHITNKGACTWYDFARRVLDLSGMSNVEIEPIRSEDWPSPTRRPKYSVLRHYSLELQGRDNLRSWEDALADFISGLSL